MKTVTWSPGSDKILDQIFDNLREQRYQDRTHRYWSNYSSDSFKFAVALTIWFNDNDEPEVCSSIANRNCWPEDVYRIHNRLWKHTNKLVFPRVMSENLGQIAQSQIEWLEQNTNYKMYFISRQTNSWENWLINNFKRFNIDFVQGNNKYLTCPDECNDTCWQRIIYHGDKEILNQWKHRPL